METAPLFSTAIPDSYLGTRFNIVDTDINGFYFGRTQNERVGVDVWNDSTGTAATAGFVASRSSTPFTNSISMQFFGINYFGTPLQDKGGLYTTNNMVFVGANAANFEWYGLPDSNLGAMSTTPIMDLDTNGILRLQHTSVAEIDASGNGDEVPTVDWVNEKANAVRKASVTLSAGQIKAIGTTPIEIIPAQGAGTVINVLSVTYNFNWGSVAFDSNVIDIGYNGGNTYTFNGFYNVSKTANSTETFQNTNSIVHSQNTAVEISGTDSVATGDSTIDVHLLYEIVTV
jgi:hypothetical protein